MACSELLTAWSKCWSRNPPPDGFDLSLAPKGQVVSRPFAASLVSFLGVDGAVPSSNKRGWKTDVWFTFFHLYASSSDIAMAIRRTASSMSSCREVVKQAGDRPQVDVSAYMRLWDLPTFRTVPVVVPCLLKLSLAWTPLFRWLSRCWRVQHWPCQSMVVGRLLTKKTKVTSTTHPNCLIASMVSLVT